VVSKVEVHPAKKAFKVVVRASRYLLVWVPVIAALYLHVLAQGAHHASED